LLALGKWDPLRFAQQVELSILSKLALITAFCIDATLWRRRNAIGYSDFGVPKLACGTYKKWCTHMLRGSDMEP